MKIFAIMHLIMLYAASLTFPMEERPSVMSNCATRYPVILVHGIATRDDKDNAAYWGRIPERLRAEGARVFFSGQDAWRSHASNATFVKRSIFSAMKSKGKDFSFADIASSYTRQYTTRHSPVKSNPVSALPHHLPPSIRGSNPVHPIAYCHFTRIHRYFISCDNSSPMPLVSGIGKFVHVVCFIRYCAVC